MNNQPKLRLKNLNHKDIFIRASKTALATFVATVIATNQPYSKQALVAAVSAAGTAVLNYILQVVG